MTKIIFCQKLKREEPALESAPYPGELGKKIFENISKPAWDLWLKRQTMLINEYRLNVSEKSARTLLAEEMERFLFQEDTAPPPGYTEIK